MAQNVTVQGASYSSVPAVILPKTGGGSATFTDVTDTTATASDVASGKYFYTAAGTKTQGTGTSGGYITQDANGYVVLSSTNGVPTLINKTITESGTYSASTDGATGYSSVTVNVSGGEMNISTDFAISNQDYTLTFSNIQSAPSKFVLVYNNPGTYQYFGINNKCVLCISYDGTTTDAYATDLYSNSYVQFYKFASNELSWSYSNSQHKLTFTIDSQMVYFFDSNSDSTYGYRLYYA